jgi:hypothetical protein
MNRGGRRDLGAGDFLLPAHIKSASSSDKDSYLGISEQNYIQIHYSAQLLAGSEVTASGPR